MIHVRFEGRSYDLSPQHLALQVGMPDVEIKRRIAKHLDIAMDRFKYYVIDRSSQGHLIVRPEAVYG